MKLRRPSDFHTHLRQVPDLAPILRHNALYEHVLWMGNLVLPRLPHEPEAWDGRPVMTYGDLVRTDPAVVRPQILRTVLLTPFTTLDMLRRVTPHIAGVKIMLAGSTTNSKFGVHSLNDPSLDPHYEHLSQVGVPVLIHAEDPSVEDEMERERAMLPEVQRLLERFQSLQVVVEHLTTRDAVQFVSGGPGTLRGSITAHHLFLTSEDAQRNRHLYCKPIPKREADRETLREAAFGRTENSHRFFFGSDSAPHRRSKKESNSCCAGVFVPDEVAITSLAELFEREDCGALDRFWSLNGCAWYGLLPSLNGLHLEPTPWTVPQSYLSGDPDDPFIPFRAGETIRWSVR